MSSQQGEPPDRPVSMKSKSEIIWLKALSHPLRIAILEVLYEKVASPKELGESFDVEVTTISYHCRTLLGAGYIEEVRRVRRRGAQEHFYRTTPQSSFGSPRWRNIPRALRGHASAEALGSFMRVAGKALQSGAIDDRDDTVLTWMPLTVNSSGWSKVVAVFKTAQAQLELIDEECRAAATDPHDLIPVVVGLAAFELRPPQTRRAKHS